VAEPVRLIDEARVEAGSGSIRELIGTEPYDVPVAGMDRPGSSKRWARYSWKKVASYGVQPSSGM